MSTPKLTAEASQKLTEAAVNLRNAPGFKVIETHLKSRLDDLKDQLINDQSAAVPNLQGRAQMLVEILELLNRK